jgi:hypothetical protein
MKILSLTLVLNNQEEQMGEVVVTASANKKNSRSRYYFS